MPAVADDHKANYPGAQPISIRVTGDRTTGQLLGAQLVGERGTEIAKRVDIFATALFHGMSGDDIADLDLSYTPPLGSPWDAVQMAARAWVRTAGPAPARRPPDRVPTVLFVCEHNAGRSQLAAGLAAVRGGGRVRVLSAGTNPDAQVDDVMLASLAEIGIDRSDQVPTQLTGGLIQQADVIVAVKPNLGIVPADGAQLQTWTLPEPQRWDVEGLRSLRDFLDEKVRTLIEVLTRPHPVNQFASSRSSPGMTDGDRPDAG